MNPDFITLLIGAYFLGSIPFAFIIAKAYGKNLRQIGSGNIGATNLSRACGKKWAYICFALDVLKGVTPVTAAAIFIIGKNPDALDFAKWLAVGGAAIIGHVFPIWLGFKGGKGVATSFGVVLGIWPYCTVPAVIVFCIWLICLLIWRYISLASILAAAVFPAALGILTLLFEKWKYANLWPLISAAALLAAMVILKHRSNIQRILAGTESKIMQQNKK